MVSDEKIDKRTKEYRELKKKALQFSGETQIPKKQSKKQIYLMKFQKLLENLRTI